MQPPAGARGTRFDTRLKRRLVALSAAVLVTLGGLRAIDLYDQRRSVLAMGESNAAKTAELLAVYLAETFRTVDVGLRAAAAFAAGAAARDTTEAEWQRFLDVQRASLDLGSVSVTDADGVIRHSSISRLVGQSRRDDPLYRRAAAGADALVADVPMRSQSNSERTILPVGRRLAAPDGRFAGAVVATVPSERLQAFFQSVDVGSRGTVWVFHPDGVVLFRQPANGDDHHPGESAAGNLLLARGLESAEPVVWRGPEVAGGADRLAATRHLRSPELLLAVSLDSSELLDDWRHAVLVSVGILGIVALLLAAGLWTVFRQVDARRLAERSEFALRARQRELQEYVDSMSTMSAKVAPDGTILMANRIGRLASGLSEEELLGSNLFAGDWWTFDPEVAARVRDRFARACTGEAQTFDERLFAFGRVLDASFSMVPVGAADGAVEYVVVEGRDITEVKLAQNELARRTRDLEAANEELEAFSYSVSHDLRAPLRAIAGFVDVLEDEKAELLDDEGRRLLRIISSNAVRMGELIDDLLRFSRLGRVPLADGLVDMRALAASVIDELGAAAVCEVSTALPPCHGDAAVLRQVWTNLVGNALKFSRSASAPRVEIGGRIDGDAAVYSVRDNGVGFDMTHAANLFGVFERLHDPAEFEGTGVGLAIVKRVVERHGGRVWAESRPGLGAAFFFSLPGIPHPG